jgi:telomerase reverse transcriptase
MRHTDDYLLITTDLGKAKDFVTVMNKGHPEYGCFLSKDKTLTSFDYDEQILNVVPPRQQFFPWCGYAIQMTDLSVEVDYDRYMNIHLRNTLTIARGRSSGRTFLNKMLLLAKARSHIIYTDSRLNSAHTVYKNIYQNFLLTAMKMDAYVRDWEGKRHRGTHKLVKDAIKQVSSYCFSAMRSKALNRIAQANNRRFDVQKADVLWLGAHAFHKVFSRRPQKYTSLLRTLAFDLKRGKNRNRYKKFQKVISDGLEKMMSIEF